MRDGVARSDRAELAGGHRGLTAPGCVPLVPCPLALLRRHLRAAGAGWGARQSYLEPAPKDLGLRSRL